MPIIYGTYDPSVPIIQPATNSNTAIRITRRGEVRIIDFITEMIAEGRGFQVRSGTIATGLAAQNVIADTSADFCYDAATNYTLIPIQLGVAVREVNTALTLQVALKAVSTASSSGTAFVPLSLLGVGQATAQGTARVAADAVVVAAEVVTTTARIWEFEVANTQTPATVGMATHLVTVGANAVQLQYHQKAPGTVYFQIASTTAQTLYFSHMNVIELPSASIG